MAFWGVEVKSGKPIALIHQPDKGRLHVTRATLTPLKKGKDKETKNCALQCTVGDGPALLLCSLLPGIKETCSLNLQFDEDQVVKIAVLGPYNVHLTGFYEEIQTPYEEEEEEDYSEEDNSDESEGFSDEGEDLIDYTEDEEEDLMPNIGVKIEEIFEEEPLKKIVWKQEKDKEELKAKSAGTRNVKEVIIDGSQSEDEDGFPIPGKRKIMENRRQDEAETEPPAKKQITEAKPSAATEAIQDAPKEAKLDKKKNKKKKKGKNKDKGDGAEKNKDKGDDAIKEGNAPTAPSTITGVSKSEEKVEEENGDTKGNNVRSFPNGLVIEEVAIGKPDGKKAAPGNRLSLYYTGKLKKNGKIFDSNVGRKPFQFRLGVGEVISGWDVGVMGLRVGDKRRLTIPPSMGYGAKGAGQIPGNTWLVFDVELVNVK